MFYSWRCTYLPWHETVEVRRLSQDAEYFRCSCGREYAINDHVRVVLPWSHVRDFYEVHPSEDQP